MNKLYIGFQEFDVLSDEELANLTQDEKDSRPQVLVGVRSSVAEGLTLTRASKTVMMEPLAIPALEEQSHSRTHRIGQRKKTKVWSLSCTGDEGVSSETHVRNVADARKIFSEQGKIWDVKVDTAVLEDKLEKGEEGNPIDIE